MASSSPLDPDKMKFGELLKVLAELNAVGEEEDVESLRKHVKSIMGSGFSVEDVRFWNGIGFEPHRIHHPLRVFVFPPSPAITEAHNIEEVRGTAPDPADITVAEDREDGGAWNEVVRR